MKTESRKRIWLWIAAAALAAAGCSGAAVQAPSRSGDAAPVESALSAPRSGLLHYAVRNGHAGRVAELLAAGAEVDARNAEGKTPLHAATLAGRIEIMRLLIDAGADPNAVSGQWVTPLHEAARTGDHELAAALIEAGWDVYVNVHEPEAGKTPLHVAARSGHAQVAQVLLDAGATVDARDWYCSEFLEHLTPLFYAVEAGSLDGVVMLVEAGANDGFPSDGNTPCDIAWDAGHKEIVSFLDDIPDRDVDTCNHIMTWCGKATEWGWGYTPLHAAAAAGHAEVVKVLLAAGASNRQREKKDENVWPYCDTPLHVAARNGHANVARLLIDAGAFVDSLTCGTYVAADQETPLYWAAKEGHADVARLLVEAGADIHEMQQLQYGDDRDAVAFEVLDHALNAGHVEVAKLLEEALDIAELDDRGLNRLAETRKHLAKLVKDRARKAEEDRMWQSRRFQDCDACPEMVVLPAGSFLMGSPEREDGRFDDEDPQHRVTIREAFAVGVYEVTFEEWDACVADDGCGGYRPDDRGWGRGRRPVIYVSWENARAYVEWLSRKTGEKYRLLSEAEWEYAARAGMRTLYSFGDEITENDANYGRNIGKTQRVGSYSANGYGLYDMHGNVYEWVQDCGNGSYAGAPTNGSAWERGDCSSRVLRGGSWDHYLSLLRSANRLRFRSGLRLSFIGFRVARTLAP